MNFIKITIFFCLLLLSSFAFSNESEEIISKVEDLRLAMEINTDLYMSTKSVISEINLEAQEINNDEILKVEQMLLAQANSIIEKSAFEQREIAKKGLLRIKWRPMAIWFIEKLKSMRSFIRQKGMFYVGYALTSNILQLTIPTALLYADQHFLAFVVFHIVGDIPVYLYYKGVSSLFYRSKMNKMMGGADKFREYKKLQKELRKSLAVKNVNDWIYTDSKESSRSILIKKEGIISKIKNRMGMNSSELSLYNLKTYLGNELAQKYPDIALILNNDDIDPQMKTLLATVKIMKDFSAGELFAFKLRFSNSFFENGVRIEGLKVKEWIDDCFNAKEFSELRFKLLNPPSEIKYARQYNSLWKEIILPKLSENFSLINFNDYRSLVLNYDQFFVEQVKNKLTLVDESLMNLMSDYMDLALSNAGPSCAEKFDKKIGDLVERVKKKVQRNN